MIAAMAWAYQVLGARSTSGRPGRVALIEEKAVGPEAGSSAVYRDNQAAGGGIPGSYRIFCLGLLSFTRRTFDAEYMKKMSARLPSGECRRTFGTGKTAVFICTAPGGKT
jgi:hypothetical protein